MRYLSLTVAAVAGLGGLHGTPASAAPAEAPSAIPAPACWSSPGPGSQVSLRTGACAVPVIPGRAVTLSAAYRSTGTVRAVVYAYSAARGWRTWFEGPPFAAAAAWTPLSTTTPPAPAGTSKAAVGLISSSPDLDIDNVVLRDATPVLRSALRPAFRPAWPKKAGLITNSYANRNPNRRDSRHSRDWQVTAGSLFARGGSGYTGRPDDGSPGPDSAVHTGSAVFRMNTRRTDFTNVAVSFDLYVAAQTTTGYTPASDYDGVHIWLRHASQYELYAASVVRRDGRLMVKKKCPGGPSNGGTYYVLGEMPGFPTVFRRWVPVAASAQNNADGSVTIVMSVAGRPVLSVVDDGIGCAPITAAAPVGIRGDNTEFQFRTVVVRNLWQG
ncbi:hypothetical protein COUCH_10355 [Couchioplanes caeruleus]|uniref:hypothetical protein n=1 Tax=Couchioplanes caeruleus TaxID=56438 RepID=UPI0020BDDD99|nr:hypothetical protein [Couchioplanes caeruleus]UQU66633.1 hypothetical protein COUCH_10355 [Couchioplanes caeruleus]